MHYEFLLKNEIIGRMDSDDISVDDRFNHQLRMIIENLRIDI